MKKVLHVLNSEVYSGAEKVVSQIIKMMEATGDYEMIHCSLERETVRRALADQEISFVPLDKMTPAALKKVIREVKPDVIHAHDMRASFVAALSCGSIPLISHIHNNSFDARGITTKSVAYLVAAIKAKRIIWVSQSALEGYVFHKLFEKKSRVLYNIIDTDRLFTQQQRDRTEYDIDVIFLGRLCEPKNPDKLMHVMKKVVEQKPDAKIAVVGDGELEAEAKRVCTELALDHNVTFWGYKSNPIKMLADSKVMILTSLWEGTPMCALEAMALGVPVVSTLVDGMLVLVKDGVEGFLRDDNDGLASCVVRLLEDDALRAQMGERAKETFARFNDMQRYQLAIEECYRG